MTRVWLTEWEWGCCGDPFSVGDEIDFGVATRDPHPPMTGRKLGTGVFVGSRPSRYVIEIEPVPDTAALAPVDGVRLPRAQREEPPLTPDLTADPPPERRRRSLAGWLVDVREN